MTPLYVENRVLIVGYLSGSTTPGDITGAFLSSHQYCLIAFRLGQVWDGSSLARIKLSQIHPFLKFFWNKSIKKATHYLYLFAGLPTRITLTCLAVADIGTLLIKFFAEYLEYQEPYKPEYTVSQILIQY